MPRPIPACLAVVALAGLPLAGVASPAAARAPVPAPDCRIVPDAETAAGGADVVFLGTIQSSKATGNGPQRQITYRVGLERTYSGELTRSPVTVTSPAGRNGLGTPPKGQRWVFFADGGQADLTANACSGSRQATAKVIRQVEGALGDGTAYVEPPPAPDPLTYEELGASRPTELTRLLAPGAAVSLIGLLGLVLLRRRSSG